METSSRHVSNFSLFFGKVDDTGSYAVIHVPTTSEDAHLDLTTLNTVGAHNAQNAGTAALLVLGLDIGLNQSTVQNAIPFLKSLPHRMQTGNNLILNIFSILYSSLFNLLMPSAV